MQYPVQMDADLDRYLKQTQLTVFVFDDRDPQVDRYVARADVPLIPLAHENQIRGTFDLYDDRGQKNGTMDVILKWAYAYLPPSSATRTPAQRAKAGPSNTREPLALLPDESVSGHKTLADKQKEMNVRLKSSDVVGSDNDQRSRRGSPDAPGPSVSRTAPNGRPNGHQNGGHSRTSSNASLNSKRGKDH